MDANLSRQRWSREIAALFPFLCGDLLKAGLADCLNHEGMQNNDPFGLLLEFIGQVFYMLLGSRLLLWKICPGCLWPSTRFYVGLLESRNTAAAGFRELSSSLGFSLDSSQLT